jgi:hypothetical protein
MDPQAPAPQQSPPVAWTPPTPPAPSQPRGFDFTEFIRFRYLITPAFITVVYVIGAIVITIAALGAMASGGGNGLIAGLFVLVFGNLYFRVILEFVMVLFRMNDSLQSIDRRGRGM